MLFNAPNQGQAPIKFGMTPLTIAVRAGRDAVMKQLLALGEDVSLKDMLRFTAAEHACLEGKASGLSLLLDAEVSGNLRTDTTDTLLPLVAQRQSPECVQLLLARGTDVDATDGVINCAALHFAVESRWGRYFWPPVPTPRIRNRFEQSPLDFARHVHGDDGRCISPLEAALAAPDFG